MNPPGNKKMMLGIAASVATILMAIYLPFLQSVFSTVPLRDESWISIMIASILIVLVTEILKRALPGLKD